MDSPLSPIYCGVAGWSYPDWEGFVYTGRIKDQLQFLARFVDMIEVNSSFYRPPAARTTESWVRRTEFKPGFFFSAKLHQDITHQGKLEDEMVRAFRDGFAPMVRAGKLRHLLAQFRYDFADVAAARDLLRSIRDRFADLAEIVVEVRHISWQAPEALGFLSSLGVTVANLDYPLARDSFQLRECRVGTNGYLRLHGRNRAAWFDKKAGRDETYNYYYSPQELKDIKARAVALASSFRSLTIVANNHFRGKEVANALELKSLLAGTHVPVPPGLLQEYPRLAEIALPQQE